MLYAQTNETAIEWTAGELRIGQMVNFKYVAHSNSSIDMPIDVIIERGMEGVSLDQFKAFKDQTVGQIENMSIILNQTTTLVNNTAYETLMAGDQFGVPYAATQAFTIVGDRAIAVMYIAEAHEFAKYLPYYDYMVDNL